MYFSVVGADVIDQLHAEPIPGHVSLTAGTFGPLPAGARRTFPAHRVRDGVADFELSACAGEERWSYTVSVDVAGGSSVAAYLQALQADRVEPPSG